MIGAHLGLLAAWVLTIIVGIVGLVALGEAGMGEFMAANEKHRLLLLGWVILIVGGWWRERRQWRGQMTALQYNEKTWGGMGAGELLPLLGGASVFYLVSLFILYDLLTGTPIGLAPDDSWVISIVPWAFVALLANIVIHWLVAQFTTPQPSTEMTTTEPPKAPALPPEPKPKQTTRGKKLKALADDTSAPIQERITALEKLRKEQDQ